MLQRLLQSYSQVKRHAGSKAMAELSASQAPGSRPVIALRSLITMAKQEHLANTLAREYVDEVMAKSSLAITGIAKRSGLAATTLYRLYEHQDRKPNARTLKAVEDAMKVPLPPELAALIGRAAHTEGSVPEPGPVPLYALVGTRFPGLFYRNLQAGDVAPRLAGIQHAGKVYALRMPDDSMAPWRRPNELIYIDPSRVTSEGDHCLVELSPEHDANHDQHLFAVRRLAQRGRHNTVLRQYASDDLETIPAARVIALHRVLEWNEAAIRAAA
jgi:phage repressor protein C with HTH and peptisase S24 domain